MAAAIAVAALERSFDDVLAVRGVDLEVGEGEIYGFLGPNGAGKTTTVRMLTTLLLPTGGRATVAGHDVVSEARRVRASIGVALQEAALDPLMTGRELIRLQATLQGLPGAEGRRRADDLLERVDLADAADHRVGTYSGGMQRRLDLAAALVHEPRVLFLDEPTTGLDPVSRKTIWEEVRALNDEGTTVFLTTQYLEEADQLADNVGIIDSGRIVAEGTPAALKAELGHPHIRLQLAEGSIAAAEEVCGRIGPLLPPVDGKTVLVEVEHGAGDIPRVVRALDEAGIEVGSLELVRPSLDDVFVAKTGLNGVFGALTQLRGFEVGAYESFIVPVSMLQGAGFTGAAAGVNLARDIEQGWLDRLLVSPAPRWVLLAGTVLAASARALIPATFVLAIALPLGAGWPGIDGLLVTYFMVAAMAAVAACWGSMLALRFKSQSAAPLMQAATMGAILLTPAYAPLVLLQGWLQDVARVNPVTQVLDAARQGFVGGVSWAETWPGLLALAGLLALLVALALREMRRTGA